MGEVFARYFHFIGFIALFAAVTAQHLMLKNSVDRVWLQKAGTLNKVYAIGGVIAVIAGLTLWMAVGKPASFYSGNWVFHLKITLVVVVGVLSVIPTLFIKRQLKTTEPSTMVPKKVTMVLRTELLLLAIIVLLANFMAQGYGLGQS